MNTATEAIEATLPLQGKLVVFQCTGLACDSPIFYEGAKCSTKGFKFHWSSYGMMPPNYKEFKKVGGFGLCGTVGSTNDVQVVARSIKLLNEKHRVGLCQGYVIDELRNAGYIVEQVDAGFR